MKITKTAVSAGLLAAALMVPAPGRAQSNDQSGRRHAVTPHVSLARATADPAVIKDGQASLSLNIDLRGVVLGGEPAQLGAYRVKVTFDGQKVAFLGAAGGSNPRFTDAPTSTAAARANATGEIRIVGDQAGSTGSTGLVNVAQLQFRELVPGGAASIKVQLLDAASALQRGDAGSVDNFKIPVEVAE